jgi:hypothetical protein
MLYLNQVFHGVSIGGLPLHVVFQIKHVVIVTLKLVLTVEDAFCKLADFPTLVSFMFSTV